jgi:uncharacterized linocin/CFP29 family protein
MAVQANNVYDNQVHTQVLDNFDARNLAMYAMFGRTSVDFREYRKLETLPREAWEDIDDQVITTAKENLVGIADLNTIKGMSEIYDGMGASVYTRKRTSETGEATNAVTPDNQSDTNVLDMDDLSVPMIVTYKDFTINTKQQSMASRIGLPLSLTLVSEATRSVARKLEENLFTGLIEANGATLYGYTTFPQRLEAEISDWSDDVNIKPDQIMREINSMMSQSMENNHRGPWMLYIPWQYQVRLNEDYTTGADYPVAGSIRNRLRQLPNLIDIRIASFIPDGEVVLVEMTSDTITLINGMPMRALAWEPNGTPHWNHKFKVMAIAVPLCVADYKGQCGIVHGTQA